MKWKMISYFQYILLAYLSTCMKPFSKENRHTPAEQQALIVAILLLKEKKNSFVIFGMEIV